MAALLLLASFAVWCRSYTKKRALIRSARFFNDIFLGHLQDLAASLAIVMLFYNGLLWILGSGWQWITAADLRWLEHTFVITQRSVTKFKV